MKWQGQNAERRSSWSHPARVRGLKYKRIVKMREVLETMKAVNPSITTVYVMSLTYGDLGKLTAADYIIAEAMNVNVSMISQVHNAAKHLYVWTVNAKESIAKMAELNVVNIITDDIELA